MSVFSSDKGTQRRRPHGPHRTVSPRSERVGDIGDMGCGRTSPCRPPGTSEWLQGSEPVERLTRQPTHVEVDAAGRSLVRGPRPPAGSDGGWEGRGRLEMQPG